MPDYTFDSNTHVKIGDRGYAYSQISPGKHRIVALMDFGIHEEAFIDDERAKHLLSMYKTDFKLDGEVKNFRSCLRPQSHDDLPIVGSMSYFPNVVLNLGHGGHGTSISLACAKMV